MKRKTVIALCMLSIAATMGSYSSVMAEEKTSAEAAAESKEAIENELKDGIYTADFDTDSNMFHVNEAKDGKGTLTVKNGEMTIHVSLVSKSIINLFSGKAEDAQKEGAKVLGDNLFIIKFLFSANLRSWNHINNCTTIF